MSFFKCILVLFACSSIAFAITRQDLEQMQSELSNSIKLELIDSILLESGVHFEKKISHYSNRPEYQGICLFSSEESPVYISVEFDHIATNYGSYKEKRIVRKIGYGSNKNHSAYRFVDGRFQYHEDPYWDNDVKKRKDIESLIKKSNSILDKIDQLNLTCESSTRCDGALQGRSLYQMSDMLGSRGICNGSDTEFQTCNYRVILDDGTTADISIAYINSGNDYTPLSMVFNEAKDATTDKVVPVKTVKIGNQEWMDHNLLYGEGLTAKYGVGKGNLNESYSVPSGEVNSWFVFMDLNLRQNRSFGFIEKPNVRESHQGVCPTGFHVPTRAEWKELFSFVAKDKVRFLKYDLFEEYNVVLNEYEKQTGYGWGSSSEKSRKLKKKLESIENELDVAYNKWRKGKKDGFYCENGEKCRFNKYDMRNVIEREVIRHLCSKEAWPLDENGKEMCFDSYDFSLPSDSKTGNDISYWTADVETSKCHDGYADGRHQCTYDVAGYGFSIKSDMQEFRLLKFETMLGLANLRCLKNRSKK